MGWNPKTFEARCGAPINIAHLETGRWKHKTHGKRQKTAPGRPGLRHYEKKRGPVGNKGNPPGCGGVLGPFIPLKRAADNNYTLRNPNTPLTKETR
jgi:hypothetical protein